MRTIVSIICFFMALSSAVAVTWYVAPDGNDGAAGTSWDTALLTIGAGVTKASAPDTVLVSNGVYVVTSQIQISKDITVRSVNGKEVTIVDGNYPTTINRCFYIQTFGIVDGFTITNGAIATEGGGVRMNLGGTVQNCTITGNRVTGATSSGGGVWMSSGVLSNCTISGNTAVYYGSGVALYNGAVVQNCVISNNTVSDRGGAVFFSNGTVQDCAIVNNTSANYGGGVNFWSGGAGLVSNCMIAGNTCAAGGGGGIYQYGGGAACIVQNCSIISNSAPMGGGIMASRPGLLVKNCRISGNLATTGQGGGVYSGTGADEILQNCLIDGNRATNTHGGGLCVNDCTIQNCTIVSNSCRMDNGYVGGGIRSGNVGTKLQNTIIYHNSAGSASASNYTVYIAPAYFTNCCLAPAVSGGSAAYSTNNITDDPMFVDTLSRNFRLLRDSPCINAGVNQDWMTNAVDMNNWPRIDSGTVDIGCYEYVEEGSIITFY